jgi:integrating conjugative element protein (TIGR03756 family)
MNKRLFMHALTDVAFKKHSIFWMLLFFISIFFAQTTTAHALSTLAIIQHTLAAMPRCSHYRVTGICFWLDCHYGICTTNTTLRVEHYLPDAVVSVYRETDSNPWEYAGIVDQLAYPVGNVQCEKMLGNSLGYGQLPANQKTDIDTHFKEVDVIGNPALLLLKRFSELFISSVARPFKPYYLSLADSYAWRSPMLEMALYPQFVLPGVHTIGSALNSWGNVYPRTGFILQSNDAKAAAVIAQRAVDIATQANSLHVYQPLAIDCGQACHIAETKENDAHIKWQMIYPLTETTCTVFGENDTNTLLPWKSEATQAGDGNYTWVLWRHYRGCIQGRGKYLGSVNL